MMLSNNSVVKGAKTIGASVSNLAHVAAKVVPETEAAVERMQYTTTAAGSNVVAGANEVKRKIEVGGQEVKTQVAMQTANLGQTLKKDTVIATKAIKEHSEEIEDGLGLALDVFSGGLQTGSLLTGSMIGGPTGDILINLGTLALGADQIRRGVQNHQPLQIVLGSAATALDAAGLALPAGWDLTVNGAAYMILGGAKIYEGKKQHDKHQTVDGLLKMGVGSSLIAAGNGAGIPGFIAAAGFTAARMVHTHLFPRVLHDNSFYQSAVTS